MCQSYLLLRRRLFLHKCLIIKKEPLSKEVLFFKTSYNICEISSRTLLKYYLPTDNIVRKEKVLSQNVILGKLLSKTFCIPLTAKVDHHSLIKQFAYSTTDFHSLIVSNSFKLITDLLKTI